MNIISVFFNANKNTVITFTGSLLSQEELLQKRHIGSLADPFPQEGLE